MNKKIILSIFLVLLVAISISAVSAADDANATDDSSNETVVAEPKTIEVTGETAADIQSAIDEANDGDTISLKENGVYDVNATKFNLTKQVTVKGNNATLNVDGAGQGGADATFIANKAGTGFECITFINTNGPKTYGEKISGVAIQLAIENGTVDNCNFIDFSSGVYGRGAAFCTITNSYFNGSSTSVTNGGAKESGTKAVNLMGSHDITVTGCTFEGQVLDGISIASNSGNNIMTDNTFINNCYAIYFGGASTQGCIIANNSFINCGYCEDAEGNVIFKDLPVLSTQKAANGYQILENTFVAREGSVLLKAESGNTAHGYPSKIGDINITNNVITVAEGADADSITFVALLSNSGALSPYAPIAIVNNTIDSGVTPVSVWYADWDATIKDNETNATTNIGVIIAAADPAATAISVVSVATADQKIVIELADVNKDLLAGKVIAATLNDEELGNFTTDENGQVTIDATADGVYAFAFAGEDTLGASEASITFTSTASAKKVSVVVAESTNITAPTVPAERTGEYYTYQLTDEEGNPLVEKELKIGFNGHVYNATTDENGQAKTQINLVAGGYTFAVCFLGDDEFEPSFEAAKVTVVKQTGSLTAPTKSFKASASKTLTTTFKDDKGNLVANKKVTFTVNGKTYTAKTNAKGVASVKVTLTTKKTYSYTVKYAGDNIFNAITKTGKITVK
ncbi:right-handed parallel beta-helix repeat-containing protein [uncultured Methanobrevibacter sp.]|uniref:right-handed parallel beta-helix repeat-containing protein n=1 Tax=uncultured Methanobrevibacter sp. TaxID=253161 RepID=UPI0026203C93